MTDYADIPRDSRRIPLETSVHFKFDRFSGFLSEYCSNISPGGMFIRTKTPSPAGTVLDFAFGLGDGFEIIRGKGEVVWNRTEDDGPERPAGIGIRFLELSEGSKELIYRMVDQYVAEGGTPFDLKEGGGGPAEGDLLFPQAAAPPPPPAADSGPSLFPDIPELGGVPEREPEPAWAPDAAPAAPSPWPDSLDDTSSTPAGFAPEVPAEPAFVPRRAAGGAAVVRSERRWRSPLAFGAALILIAGGGAAAFIFRDTLLPMIAGGTEQFSQGDMEGMMLPPAPAPAASGPAAVASDPAQPASPLATATAAPVTGPLSRIERITWEESFGGTDVTLWGNGAIREEAYKRVRIGGDPPRELIRISGVDRPFPLPRVVVGTGDILQVRTGFHPSPEGNELHIVLDLAHPSVQVTRVEAAEGRLKLHLQRGPAPPSGP